MLFRSRTIDDYEFFLQPSLVVAEGLLNSYGLRISTKAKEATQGLRDVVEECRAAVERYGGVPDWRIRLKTPPPPDAGGQAAKMMPRLRALLEQDNANELEDTQQREIEELHEKLTKRLELSFREWLDLKKLLIELRPGMARVPGRNSSILRGCPQKYTREDGFQQRLDEFMADTRAEEVEQWCAMPLAEANRGDSASRISFMLAWYFSDTGQVPLTRPAMVNLARVEISRARALGDTVEGQIGRAHV